MLDTMQKSFKEHKCVFVSGVYVKGPEGTCENLSVYENFIRFLRNKVAPLVKEQIKEQVYIIYLGWKDSKPPHPKIVKKIRDGEFIIEKGGLIVPGFTEPAAVTTLIPVEGIQAKMRTYVMGSAASNFHKFMGTGLTLRALGCTDMPDELLDSNFTTAEQVIQGWKGFIAKELVVFRREGYTDADHAEAFSDLMKATDCKAQKKLGRNVKLEFKKYGATAAQIAVRLFAGILAARAALGDAELIRFMHINRECNNEVCESAIHDPDACFTGKFPDTTWGSTLGSPQVFLFPDGVTKLGFKADAIFENGIWLFQAGFFETVTEDAARNAARTLFNAIWAETLKAAKALEADLKAKAAQSDA